MNINEKVQNLQKILKIKFVIPSERPIYTPECFKSGLNDSLWSTRKYTIFGSGNISGKHVYLS